MKTTFHVSGTAERYSAPERAIIHIQISATSLTRGEAYGRVASVQNSLSSTATQFGLRGATTWFDASAPSSYSYQETWVPDGSNAEPQSRTRYAASSRVSVKFQDFDALADWLAELSDQEMISVTVEWALTEATRKALQKEIRGEAVANARELAEDYARGDGIDVDNHRLKLVSISDSKQGGLEFYGSHMRSSAMAMDSSAPVVSFSPEEIKVDASISAVFETATA